MIFGKLKYIILQLSSDMVSANVRTMAHCTTVLPRNIFHIIDYCSVHRLHRIIASVSEENKLAGDVHAAVFACTLTSNREKMLKTWKVLIDEGHMQRYIGQPLPEWHVFGMEIWMHTMGRQQTFTCATGSGDSLLASSGMGRIMEAGQQFLRFWNGDPRLPRPSHWCNGCCSDEAAVRENTFAVGCQLCVV